MAFWDRLLGKKPAKKESILESYARLHHGSIEDSEKSFQEAYKGIIASLKKKVRTERQELERLGESVATRERWEKLRGDEQFLREQEESLVRERNRQKQRAVEQKRMALARSQEQKLSKTIPGQELRISLMMDRLALAEKHRDYFLTWRLRLQLGRLKAVLHREYDTWNEADKVIRLANEKRIRRYEELARATEEREKQVQQENV